MRSLYRELIRAIAEAERAVATFISFFATACDKVSDRTGCARGSDGE